MDKKLFAKKLGLRVKKLRRNQRLSQEELAEKIDKTVDTISSIERGISSPRLETALELSKVFDIPLHELFQVSDLSTAEKARMDLLEEINTLLKNQPTELLGVLLEQIQQILRLKENLTRKK